MARPKMKTAELGAAPQMAEEISNRRMFRRRTGFVGQKV
jgi:hypothetical protein